MCLSIHVSHCLEEFSPQTSPSGIIYPMVGVPSMCPPHPFFHFPTSGHPCGPTFCQPGPFTACAPPRAPFCAPLHTPVHLCTPLHTFVLHLSWACHKVGPHGCPEVGKWKNGCGGHIEGTPTIG